MAALTDPFGLFGLITGLLAVVLLIRQSIWTWPIGTLYAVVSVYVFAEARLYSDLLLHVFYVGLNLYGWWYWLRGGDRDSTSELPVTRAGPALLAAGGALAVLGTLALGTFMHRATDADFAYADAATTVFSLFAMWLQARKYLDSWVLWFGIDIAASTLYFLKAAAGDTSLLFYGVLYLVYLGLAVIGYRAWHASLQTAPHTPARPVDAA
ncbi:MAG: nicotinamide riboside transporter PnuC [Pseudomonadota bacterium]